MKKIIALVLVTVLVFSTLNAIALTYSDKTTVQMVQEALNNLYYDCGTPDGIAGKKTYAAIEAFQRDKGLRITGEINDTLLSSIGRTIAVLGTDIAINPNGDEDLHDPFYFNSLLNELFEEQVTALRDEFSSSTSSPDEAIAYLVSQYNLPINIYIPSLTDSGKTVSSWYETNSSLTGLRIITKSKKGYIFDDISRIHFEFTNKESQYLDLFDYYQLGIFFVLSDMLLVDDQNDSHANDISALFSQDDNGMFPLEQWDKSSQSENIIIQTKDYYITYQNNLSDSGSLCFDVYPGEWVDPTIPTVSKEGDDVPPIPDYILAQCAGLPETIEELSSSFDIEKIQSLYLQWEQVAETIVSEVLSDGSCVIPDFIQGVTGGDIEYFLESEGESVENYVNLNFGEEAGKIRVTPQTPIPSNQSILYYNMRLYTDSYAFNSNYENAKPVISTSQYLNLQGDLLADYIIRYDGEAYNVWLSLLKKDKSLEWNGIYDNSGKLQKKTYSEYSY